VAGAPFRCLLRPLDHVSYDLLRGTRVGLDCKILVDIASNRHDPAAMRARKHPITERRTAKVLVAEWTVSGVKSLHLPLYS
jgi:hypothetical protein